MKKQHKIALIISLIIAIPILICVIFYTIFISSYSALKVFDIAHKQDPISGKWECQTVDSYIYINLSANRNYTDPDEMEILDNHPEADGYVKTDHGKKVIYCETLNSEIHIYTKIDENVSRYIHDNLEILIRGYYKYKDGHLIITDNISNTDYVFSQIE